MQRNRYYFKAILVVFFGLLLILWLGAVISAPYLLKELKYATVVYDRGQNLLAARISEDGQWRFPQAVELPERYIACLKNFEDKRFALHPGIDPIALVRAIGTNLNAGKIVSGGSTITMQLARLLCKHSSRGWWAKIVECWYAVGLEFHFSKSELLRLYASLAPYGGNVVGIDAALWRYFKKTNTQISWAEAALLAVLPNQPSSVHLERNREILKRKRDRLLDKIYDSGLIDSSILSLSKEESIPEQLFPMPKNAIILLDYLKSKYPDQYRFYTTIDFSLQNRLTELTGNYSQQLRNNEIHNVSVLLVDNINANVLAYIPNNPLQDSTLRNTMVDNIQSLRSSGSILKPLLYGMAIDRGLLNERTILADIPTRIGDFNPENFSRTFLGAVTAKRALQQSLNIPAVRLLQEYGLNTFYENLHKLGFRSIQKNADHYGLSLILGGAEVKSWDLAMVYSGLVRQLHDYFEFADVRKGNQYANIHILKDERESSVSTTQKVMSNAAIYHMLHMMQSPPPSQSDEIEDNSFRTDFISWKTGTSFGFKDAWCVGIDPKYTIVVWIGNSNGLGRPGLIGIHTAAPLMFRIALSLGMRAVWREPLDEMKPQVICRASGYPPSLNCPETDTLLLPVTSSLSVCPYHKQYFVDRTERYRVFSECESNAHKKLFYVYPPLMEYYYAPGHVNYIALPPYRNDCNRAQQSLENTIQFIYPQNRAQVFIPIDLDLDFNKPVFKVASKNAESAVFWFLDGNYIGQTNIPHEISILPEPGFHNLKVIDDTGQSAFVRFECLRRKSK